MSHEIADVLFHATCALCFAPSVVNALSLHSGRVWLACALLASDYHNPTTQAMCRYDGKAYVAGDELPVVRAAQSDTVNGGKVAVTAQTSHPCKTCIPGTGIKDRSCVTSAHETLPWGSHYRNLVTASGHAWVAFALDTVPRCERPQLVLRRRRQLKTMTTVTTQIITSLC